MRYVIKAVYPHVIPNRFVQPSLYRDWLTFEGREVAWIPEAMQEFAQRYYSHLERQHYTTFVHNKPLAANMTTPNVSIVLEDRTIIRLFQVEVKE